MKRVLSKYNVYTNHIAALTEDRSVSSTDLSKLKGYYNKWTKRKYILGCAVFVNLLNPCAISSKSMQSDEIVILGALSKTKTVNNTLHIELCSSLQPPCNTCQ